MAQLPARREPPISADQQVGAEPLDDVGPRSNRVVRTCARCLGALAGAMVAGIVATPYLLAMFSREMPRGLSPFEAVLVTGPVVGLQIVGAVIGWRMAVRPWKKSPA